MAAELPLYLLLLVIPLLCLLFRRRRSGGPRLPPGPLALPVIGHMHHLAGALPHRAMRDLARRHGPLMLLRLCQLPVVVASSPDAAREIMRTHDVAFASRPIGQMLRLVFRGNEGLVFAPYGDGWRQLRKICTVELLSARRVRSLRAVREEELGRLLRSVAAAAAGPVNLTERISAFVADSALHAIVGSPSESRDTFLRLLREGLKVVPGMSLPDLFPSSRLAMRLSRVPAQIERRRRGMVPIVETIIQERREKRAAAAAAGGVEKDEDLLDVLLRLQKDMDSQYPLTTENLRNIIMDLFSAGSETSATLLHWAMAELMRNPTVMRKAQEEIHRELTGHDKVTEDGLTDLQYLRLVIKETLRLHPPVPLLLPRECGGACRVLGYDVPPGAMVFVNAWAIGRDPAHWDAPEEFVPERFEQIDRDFKGTDFEFIPFGAGRRVCPGMAFGLAHVELVLAALLFHFEWKLPDGMAPEEMDMTEEAGITTRRRSDLLLFAVPRVQVPTE